jgi:hypothetical protein
MCPKSDMPAGYKATRKRLTGLMRTAFEAIMAREDSLKLRKEDLDVLTSIVEQRRK